MIVRSDTVYKFLIFVFCGSIIFNDRIIIDIGSGGRGILPVTAIILSIFIILFLMRFDTSIFKHVIISRLFFSGVGLYFIMLVILPVFGVLINNQPIRILAESLLKIVPLSAIFFGYYSYQSNTRWNIFLNLIYYATIIVLIFSIAQFFSYREIPILSDLSIVQWIRNWDFDIQLKYSDNYLIIGRSIGTFINPNTLGIFGLLTFALFPLYNDGKRTLLLSISILIVLLSQSRGSLSALIIIIIYILLNTLNYITKNSKISKMPIFIGYIAIFTIVIYTVYASGIDIFASGGIFERFNALGTVASQGVEGDGNLLSRYSTWTDAIDVLQGNFFGTLGPPLLASGLSADNQYIYYLLQGGYIGLIIFITMILTLFSRFNDSVSLTLNIMLIAIIMNSITALPMDISSIVIFWFIIGAKIALSQSADKRSVDETKLQNFGAT